MTCLRAVYARASYVTVNISSPNTQGLRDLQQLDALKTLLGGLRDAQINLATQHGKQTPMLLKVAPDLTDADLDDVANVIHCTGFEGVIATNTTIGRVGISGKYADEQGGLSGKPVFDASTEILAKLRARLDAKVAFIGVGGILSGEDAAKKVAVGAELIQFYTGMIYRGPALIGECVEAIRAARGKISTP